MLWNPKIDSRIEGWKVLWLIEYKALQMLESPSFNVPNNLVK